VDGCGWLKGHDGWEIQLPWIQQDIEEELSKIRVPLPGSIHERGRRCRQLLAGKVPEDIVQDAPQDTRILSGVVHELQAAILGKRIHHNGDPVLTFCMSCVVGPRTTAQHLPKRVKEWAQQDRCRDGNDEWHRPPMLLLTDSPTHRRL